MKLPTTSRIVTNYTYARDGEISVKVETGHGGGG